MPAVGSEMAIVPTLLGDLFGIKYFGRNWGFVMFFNAISASILQVCMKKSFSVLLVDHILLIDTVACQAHPALVKMSRCDAKLATV